MLMGRTWHMSHGERGTALVVCAQVRCKRTPVLAARLPGVPAVRRKQTWKEGGRGGACTSRTLLRISTRTRHVALRNPRCRTLEPPL